MQKAVIHRPVRYREVARLMSRPTFAKYYRKVVGSIYLHRDHADDPDLIAEALLMRCPHGMLRGFAALSNMGFTLNLDGWTPSISIPRRSSPREWCICPFDKTSSVTTSRTITS